MSDVKELRRLLDLKDGQLAECTRVMRAVANALINNSAHVDRNTPPVLGLGDALRFQAKRLLDARAGKATS